MRQAILYEISENLKAMAVPFYLGQGTDILIRHELLDAKWSSGSKRIHYEALIFANEYDRVVYMFEETRETGGGFSFGTSGSSSFQSGKTLHRKVKSIQYGPDGKAYEYAFDLGAIPKAVKEAARRAGWKFKTVLQRQKALYPPSR